MLLGVFGGLGKKTTSRGFNRATQGIRQTGSASKPLTVLVPGIDKKLFTASTIFDDTKTTFLDKKKENYSPTNNANYLGKITVRRALESSQNIPFVEMMEKITPATSIKYLEKMGVTTLTEEDSNLALALGGLEKGVSPLEMAGAYSSIANDGVYIEPIFYTKIAHSNGKTLVTKKQKRQKVISNSVAYIIKNLLTSPVTGSHGTATNCSISGMDVAAKTGTTDDDYDRWLCGFTNYYTAVTWYGFDFNENIDFAGNQNPASVLWSNVMSSIHKKLDKSKFQKPNNVLSATICSSSGELANGNCPDTYTEYYLKGTLPSTCKEHNSSNKNNKNNTTQNQNNTINNNVSNNSIYDNSITNTTPNNIIENDTTQNNTNQNITNKTNTNTNNNTSSNSTKNNNTTHNNTSNTNTSNNNSTKNNTINNTTSNKNTNTNTSTSKSTTNSTTSNTNSNNQNKLD